MAAGAALGGLSSIMSSRSTNKALIESYKKQAQVVITNYNYNQQQLDMQEQSLYNAAKSKLYEMELTSMQNNSTVEAALNETGYEGRTKEQLSRGIEGQTLRQKQAVIDANEAEVYNVRSQKNALYIQTKNTLNNMREQTNAQLTGGSQMLMGALGGAAMGAAVGSVASVGASALSTATAAASTGSMSWAQAFTEAFSQGWDKNQGLFTSLSRLGQDMSYLAPTKRGYYY